MCIPIASYEMNTEINMQLCAYLGAMITIILRQRQSINVGTFSPRSVHVGDQHYCRACIVDCIPDCFRKKRYPRSPFDLQRTVSSAWTCIMDRSILNPRTCIVGMDFKPMLWLCSFGEFCIIDCTCIHCTCLPKDNLIQFLFQVCGRV